MSTGFRSKKRHKVTKTSLFSVIQIIWRDKTEVNLGSEIRFPMTVLFSLFQRLTAYYEERLFTCAIPSQVTTCPGNASILA